MNEKFSENFNLTQYDQEKDLTNPKLRALTLLAQAMRRELYGTNESLHNELVSFSRAIEAEHPDAREYRLFHYFVGSTPPATLEKFDIEGDDSIAKKLAEFAQKYHIEVEQV